MSLAFWRKRAPNRTKPVPVPPAPVSSSPIRVTDASDGAILNRGYAYWSQCVIEPTGTVLCFACHADGRPRFFRVDLSSGHSIRLGPLVNYLGGEGWYFTPSGDVMLCDGPRLRRVNPFTGSDVVVLEISQTHPGCDLWQSHASDDGRTFSATVRQIVPDGKYPYLGTVVLVGGEQRWFRAEGYLDESAVTPDGSWLIIKELEVPEDYNTLYNRIISLADWTEYRLSPSERIGHSDCGPGFIVGEDSNRGWCAKFDLATRDRVKLLDTWAMGSVSYRAGRCLRSSATSLSLVALDGTGETHLLDHGMIGDPLNYEFQCHANLDPSGRVAAWVSNKIGRMDLFLLRLP